MTATLTSARHEIHQAFQTVWDSGSAALNGGVIPPISYDAVAFDTPTAAAWARIRIRHEQGEQVTLGPPAQKRFNKTGTVIVSIFTPVSTSLDTSKAEALGILAKSAFEGKATPSQVWFRDVSINEIGVEESWFQVDVIATFNYDDFV